MLFEPRGKRCFLHFAGGKQAKHGNNLRFRRRKDPAIEFEKQDCRQSRNALVAVNERMVTTEANAIGRGEHNEISFRLIGQKLLRAGERGIKAPFVAQPCGTTVFTQQPAVQG